MLNENLLICMEQKVILLTHIMNLTKQIEVRCKQTEIVFDTLLEKRKAYIDRVAKCNTLIESILAQSEAKEKEHLEKILAEKPDAKANTEEEKRLLEYAVSANKALRKTLNIDKNTVHKLRKEHNEMQEMVAQKRKLKNNAVFDNFK